jgi:hypothetical protein
MSAVETASGFLVLALAIFLTLSGIAFFLAGLMPGKSAPWYAQYAYSAVALTSAYYLFRLIFDLP